MKKLLYYLAINGILILLCLPRTSVCQDVQIRYLGYDQWGNVVEMSDQNDSRFSYDWSSNGSFLKGVFKLSPENDVKAISLEAFNSSPYGPLAGGMTVYKNGNGSLTYLKETDQNVPHQKVIVTGLTDKSAGFYIHVGSQPAGKQFIVEFEYKVELGRMDLHGKNPVNGVWTDWFSSTVTSGWEKATVEVTISTDGRLYFRAPWHGGGGAYSNTTFGIRHIRMYPLSGQAISASYDEWGHVKGIYDENNKKQLFDYDPMGRLIKIRNDSGQTLQEFDYLFTGDNFSSANPNQIQTRSHDGIHVIYYDQYFDGLGRLIQIQQSLDGNSAIVQHTFYDGAGREQAVTKPVIWATGLSFKTPSSLVGAWSPGMALPTGSDLYKYYRNTLNHSANDSKYAYSQTAYEPAPTARIDKQTGPGYTWRMGAGRELRFQYGVNSLSAEAFTNLGHAVNSLHKQTLIDENNVRNWEFTDGWGRTIARVSDFSGNNAVSSPDIFTGFEYDVMDRLVKVHEPKGWGTSNFKRTYSYDKLGRLTSENNPDIEASADYLYDKAGNLRFIRNAEHKKSGGVSTDNYSFSSPGSTSYVNRGKNGILNFDVSLGYQGFEFELALKLEKNDSPSSVIHSRGYDIWDSQGPTVNNISISDGSYRYNVEEIANYGAQWQVSISETYKPFQFEYHKYDGLGRLTESGEYYGSSSQFTTANAESESFPTSSNQAFELHYYDGPNGYSTARNLKGRLARSRYLDPNSWQWGDTWYSYDEEGRVEWVRQNLPGLATKLIEYTYNRQGQVTKIAYQPGSSSDRLIIWQDYDPAGRLQKVWSHRSDNKSLAKLEAEYSYTAEGFVSNQSLGGSLSGGAQLVENSYHIRGWLERINNPGSLSSPTGFPDSRFALELRYESQSAHSTNWAAQYNGNVSQLRWKATPPSPISGDSPLYNIKYDRANRLTLADYYNPNQGSSSDLDVKSILYDKSGNFENLERYRNSSSSDAYSYRYYANTNRLMNVVGSSTSLHYKYDAVGNMKFNSNRNILNIAYDRRNLPYRLIHKINSSTANVYNYIYDSEGNRVRKGATFYVRGADGQVLGTYQGSSIQFWNLPGGIGRVTK